MPLELIPIPCRTDNYAWLIHDPATDTTTVVDAPEAAPILRELYARGWKLTHILITHHHPDHTDGAPMLEAATGARLIGAAADTHRLPHLTEEVTPGEVIPVGMQAVAVIDAPGHTLGHVAYHFAEAKLAFTGDSLMAWGCGRLFEGTPAQMWGTLTRLAALPPDTLICSGHEYTQANGRFALSLEPANPALIARMAAVAAARAEGRPTLPVPLSLELATNPFLRASDPALRAAIGMTEASDLEVFTALRALKDRF
ncbi:hydroxyacylglutathione hydrolase [Rhodobacter veldkampii DSM 11550]|uniref:Hydroxyacylglutathione hydrolase n=1 Tax=Phaeovulum veldkampii DSM 11550 TaxID=1185920 RepID=A0A2T4JI05_9RHOB|nr:hydroxyacylglutathione hydrolase [Phaeovulum veldkampii]MBK5945561.1 hydroxyacylglutathione hydrolase [Phaeovulum veldkampii DSM 11550]PTE17545.1 hydroxyacylglutathione hydrolase [Phaeovulum veldkampii DSM 11550]TDQ60291.1 hydroxyacylglutathione hydrolase [Phaeovulum veldkampii DSM 11550]